MPPKQEVLTIVLTGGGSGGHITPLLSLAHAVKTLEPSCRLVYIAHRGDKFDGLEERYRDFDLVLYINSGKFRRYHGESFWRHLIDLPTIFLNVRDFFRLFISIAKAYRILSSLNPDVVFSKGSFVSVPVGIAARLRRIPIITHDSDAKPGLANRIVGRWAVAHATGMPPGHYPYPKDSIVYVGVPTDERIKPVTPELQKDYKKSIGVPPGSLVLLVTGGGLGSQNVNSLVIKIAPKLLESNPSLHLIHFAGQKNESVVREKYALVLSAARKKRVKVLGFSPDFFKYAAAADLVISRAGATVLAELAILHKACLIIASPFLAGGHQLQNAEEIKNRSAAEVVTDVVQPEKILALVRRLLTDDTRRLELGEAMGKLAKPDATAELARLILDVARNLKKGR